MLELTSTRWSDMRHAYAEAGAIPAVLQSLYGGDASVLDELTGSICHQGTVYSASYAAFPHIVAAARDCSDHEVRAEMLILAAHICASSDYHGPPASKDILDWFEAAIPDALAISLRVLRERLEASTALYLLGAAACFAGFKEMCFIAEDLVDEEFEFPCPDCSEELYSWFDGDRLFTATEDPVKAPATQRVAVEYGPRTDSSLAEWHQWMLSVAGPSASQSVGRRLGYLFGVAQCPACKVRISLIDELMSKYG